MRAIGGRRSLIQMKVLGLESVKYTNMTGNAETTDIPAILALCIQGDQSAIESLVRTFEGSVFRLALSILDDPMDASEITQETFIAALRSLRSYRENTSFKAWLFTIAMNLSRSRLRKRKALERLRSLVAGFVRLDSQKQRSPEESLIQDEKERSVWLAVAGLDEKHRLPVILRYFHELPISEIANILNVNEGTIHSRLHHARQRLQSELKDQFKQDST